MMGVTHDDADPDKVCIVAAAEAWPFYRQVGVYVCQAERTIQHDAGRLGFYSARLIHGVAPLIEKIYPSLSLEPRNVARFVFHPHPELRRVGLALDAAVNHGYLSESVQVVLLSSLGDEQTATFEAVRHEGAAAWTMRQRYAFLSELMAASSTADLSSATAGGR